MDVQTFKRRVGIDLLHHKAVIRSRTRNPRIGENQQIERCEFLGHLGKELVFKSQFDFLAAPLEKSSKERGKMMPRSVVGTKRIAVPADENSHSFVTVLTISPPASRISSNSGILPTACVEHERQGS